MGPIVVLGMHKSGTTLVAQMLHRSGIAMVDDEQAGGYDDGNHFERASTNALNKSLLGRSGGNSLRTFRPLGAEEVTAKLRAEALDLVGGLERRAEPWGFKDPRSCLTYPVWKQVLPAHRIICVYRSPAEVHAHYTRKKSLDTTRGIRTLRAWYEYNQGMLQAFEQAPAANRLLVDYATLMQNSGELTRLSEFVGLEMRDERVASLRRAGAAVGPRLRAEASLLKAFTGRDAFALARRISSLAETSG